MTMEQPEFGITQFVRGMAWHDAGKPFIIDTGPHAALGYWLLQLAGHPGEAKVVLAHGRSSRNRTLRSYLRAGGEPLPAILLLCNALDVLSASIYSFQSRPLETGYHSRQNPFSRLVVNSAELDAAFAVRHEERVGKLYTPLRQKFIDSLPSSWQEVVTLGAMESATTLSPEMINVSSLPDADHNQKAIEVIQRFMGHYPERTYPSVNDTSLLQHCRLSGILAFVAYRNLEKGENKDWLNASITIEDGHFQRPVENDRQIVQKHLAARLVRIAFEGHKALYKSAVRVDDLHGARELTERTREAFKQALACELGVSDLADFLTISEGQFDLVYLLPPAEVPLENVVHDAYEAAIDQVTGQIIERLGRDFPQIADQRGQLGQQLGDISYGLRIIPVGVPKGVDFNRIAAQYGRNLLQAYRDCQDYTTFPATNLPGGANWRDNDETLAAAETCEVCGNYPILVPPEELEAKDEWLRKRDYAAHIFRGEREQICLSCVARRTMAYGKIARRMDIIVHPMLKPDGSEPGSWRSVKPPDGPELPPLLPATVSLERDDELRDVGAFYVRYCRTEDRIDRSALDIFPTTSYAADATGNVVLLSLQPTKDVLFARYPYDEAIKESDPEQQAGDSPADDDIALWQDTFVKFYDEVVQEVEKQRGKDEEAPDLSEPICHVQPHLARVMERIQCVRVFYDGLYRRLAEDNPRLRVLPLDTDYPTLRLLLPADQLHKALRVLDQVMTSVLFSATVPETPAERKALHDLLGLLLPDLLHGAIVLFKQKFPLYLALEAERDLFRQLRVSDPDKDRDKQSRPGNSQWYGLRLAFTDLRGTLSQVAPKRAEVTYADLGQVLDLADPVRGVDRRTVLLQAETAEYISPELADALSVIRADRIRLSQKKVRALQEEHIFPPVLFLKRATRR
jgi:hypothetical protein